MTSDVSGLRCLQLSKFYPPVPGGIESVVHELTSGLHGRGANVEVLCANVTQGTVVDACPYAVVRAGSWGKLLSTSMSPALIWQLMRRRRAYDVIHVHLPDPMASVALFMARPTGRTVVHWHSDVVNQKRALKLYEPLQAWLLRRADSVIVTSRAYAASSPWLGPFAEKVKVVPIGIQDPIRGDIAECELAATVLRQRFSGKQFVFALGRATYYKGFDVLIRAAAKLNPGVHVVIGGEGELSARLSQLAVLEGVADRVHFAGRIDQRQMSAFYLAADVFCLPSLVRAEAFGVVLLEAMAHSRAIVASKIEGSGVPWVNRHEETGLNVPPGDVDALAAALNRVLADDALRTSFGRAGRLRFEREFTADQMVNSVTDLYRDLTERNALAELKESR